MFMQVFKIEKMIPQCTGKLIILLDQASATKVSNLKCVGIANKLIFPQNHQTISPTSRRPVVW